MVLFPALIPAFSLNQICFFRVFKAKWRDPQTWWMNMFNAFFYKKTSSLGKPFLTIILNKNKRKARISYFFDKLPFPARDTEQYCKTVSSDRERDFHCHFQFVELEYNSKKLNWRVVFKRFSLISSSNFSNLCLCFLVIGFST